MFRMFHVQMLKYTKGNILSHSISQATLSDKMSLIYFERREKIFTSKLIQKVSEKQDGNVIVSPLLARSMLAMLLMGANGKIHEELSTILGLHRKYPKREVARIFRRLLAYDLVIAQKVYIPSEHKINPLGDELLERYFDSGLAQIKDEKTALVSVNNFLRTKTQCLMELSDVTWDKEKLLSVSVIYFDMMLERPCEATTEIGPSPFWIKERESVVVPMIFSQGIYKYGKIKALSSTVMEMKLQENLSLLIILPDKSMKHLMNNKSLFNAETYNNVLHEQPVSLTLPQFEVDFEYDLANILPKCSVQDFSEFSSSQLLSIGQMSQKAKVVFSGKSYASTHADPRLFNSDTPKFMANRPFLFIVRNAMTNLILMTGVMRKPSYTKKDKNVVKYQPKAQPVNAMRQMTFASMMSLIMAGNNMSPMISRPGFPGMPMSALNNGPPPPTNN